MSDNHKKYLYKLAAFGVDTAIFLTAPISIPTIVIIRMISHYKIETGNKISNKSTNNKSTKSHFKLFHCHNKSSEKHAVDESIYFNNRPY